MRAVWSEMTRRQLWRRVWVALARAQVSYGLVSEEQVRELEANASRVDIARSLAIEAEIHHDLMAEVKVFAEQCPTAGGIIHMGATSMDIEDNAEVLRMRQAIDLLLEKLAGLLGVFASQIETWADVPVIAFTHLQPAEPTTLGYRFACHAQDLLADFRLLQAQRAALRGKGFKGAVGTAASYTELLGADQAAVFEDELSRLLDLPFFPITTQTYPRRQDYHLIAALAGLGETLYKLAFDLRLLQSPPIGELAEPFGRLQVGSSAMPFKRNPIQSEKIDSLARLLTQMPAVAWNNAAHSLLERTLDDSANRRSLLPEAFLICDELLLTTTRVIKGLQIDQAAMHRNLESYAPFAGTERVLMALARAGADRQQIHERLRQHSLAAWQAVREGRPNPLLALITADEDLLGYLSRADLAALMQIDGYLGSAPQRARALAVEIQQVVQEFRPDN